MLGLSPPLTLPLSWKGGAAPTQSLLCGSSEHPLAFWGWRDSLSPAAPHPQGLACGLPRYPQVSHVLHCLFSHIPDSALTSTSLLLPHLFFAFRDVWRER